MPKEEIKTLCLQRVPPGDRWKEPNNSIVHESLTDALEHIFQKSGQTEFRFSAREGDGVVYSIEERVTQAPPPKEYSLYGDR